MKMRQSHTTEDEIYSDWKPFFFIKQYQNISMGFKIKISVSYVNTKVNTNNGN